MAGVDFFLPQEHCDWQNLHRTFQDFITPEWKGLLVNFLLNDSAPAAEETACGSGLEKKAQVSDRKGREKKGTVPNKFSTHLDVKLYKPEEITVKVINNTVQVHALHIDGDESSNNFYRVEMKKMIKLPEDVDIESVNSFWSDSGTLTIEALKNKTSINEDPRSIKIAVEKESANVMGTSNTELSESESILEKTKDD